MIVRLFVFVLWLVIGCGSAPAPGGGSSRERFTLNVQKAGSTTGSVSGGGISCGSTCSSSLESGTSVTLVAAAEPGSSFSGWAGCDSASGTACAVVLTSTRVVTASFRSTLDRTSSRLGLGRPAYGSGAPALLVDGLFQRPMWTTAAPSAASPSWAAVDVGSGPSQLLVQWSDENNPNIESSSGAPADYTLQTSADSTDGLDGSWTTAVTVAGNPYSYRAHVIPFAGQRWIKLVVTAGQGGGALAIGELELWDASAGASDTWFFLGDSITARCTKRGPDKLPGFQGYVSAMHPDRWPMQTNGGIVGQATWGLLLGPDHRLDGYLPAFPNKYWAIAVWTNDAGSPSLGHPADVYPGLGDFPARLRTIVEKIRAAGRIPIIAREPYNDSPIYGPTLPEYNAAAVAFAEANGVALGPDLYTLFRQNVTTWGYGSPRSYYDDGDHVHPNALGCKAIAEAWASAVEPIFAR